MRGGLGVAKENRDLGELLTEICRERATSAEWNASLPKLGGGTTYSPQRGTSVRYWQTSHGHRHEQWSGPEPTAERQIPFSLSDAYLVLVRLLGGGIARYQVNGGRELLRYCNPPAHRAWSCSVAFSRTVTRKISNAGTARKENDPSLCDRRRTYWARRLDRRSNNKSWISRADAGARRRYRSV